MGDRLERVVAAIRKLFVDASIDVREERVIRYIVNELRQGRSFDDITRDPYVVNNTSETARARIVENPQTLRAIEDEIEAEFKDYQRVR